MRETDIPDEFIGWQRARHGPNLALALRDEIPRRVNAACARWELVRQAGVPAFGDTALVFRVERSGQSLALKVPATLDGLADEIAALRMWDGQGMVRLHASDLDVGACLLESLGPRTLNDLPLRDALPIAGRLLRRLCLESTAASSPIAIQSTGEIAAGVRTTLSRRNASVESPLSDVEVAGIVDLARILGMPCADVIVHADLHGRNILQGTREPWLTIDPRPRRGDPEIAVAELLWTRADDALSPGDIWAMLETLVQHGGLDAKRARAWAVVRAADYLVWGLGHRLTDDPARCRRIIDALLWSC